MIHLGLIGYPLGHSLSPMIHTAALKACNLKGDYSLFPIHPDDKQGLKDLLGRVRFGEITGLNVTIPHKQNVIEFIDELTPTAKAIGAVNTIYLRDGKLVGDNTDAPGFLADLKKFIENRELGIGKSVLILGAGGSARAVVYALVNDAWNVTIAARRVEQAQELATQFQNVNVVELNLQTFQPSTFQLIVNTTPLGMSPDIDLSPLPENVCLPQHIMVYDLIYNPRETRMVKIARSQGLHATTGLGMLIEQAALAFEIWTGKNPPREILYTSVVE
ncbi:MAG: shikimate dehydrogenase [Anaerolineales bacterium]|nr:shikimate dehydrogenase [Anaerolineales bacterium]